MRAAVIAHGRKWPQMKTAAGALAGDRSNESDFAYFGYLNSGAAFSDSLVVFIEASHLLSLAS